MPPAAIAAVAAVVSAGAGVYGTIASSQKKPPEPTPLPPAPKPEDAAKKAQEEIDKKRKARLLTGGQTVLTSTLGAPDVSSETAPKTLLGG